MAIWICTWPEFIKINPSNQCICIYWLWDCEIILLQLDIVWFVTVVFDSDSRTGGSSQGKLIMHQDISMHMIGYIKYSADFVYVLAEIPLPCYRRWSTPASPRADGEHDGEHDYRITDTWAAPSAAQCSTPVIHSSTTHTSHHDTTSCFTGTYQSFMLHVILQKCILSL